MQYNWGKRKIKASEYSIRRIGDKTEKEQNLKYIE